MFLFMRHTLLEVWDFFHKNFGALCRILWPLLILFSCIFMAMLFIEEVDPDLTIFLWHKLLLGFALSFLLPFSAVFCIKTIYALKSGQPLSCKYIFSWTRKDTRCLWRIILWGIASQSIVLLDFFMEFSHPLTHGIESLPHKFYVQGGLFLLPRVVSACMTALFIPYFVSAYGQEPLSFKASLEHMKVYFLVTALLILLLSVLAFGVDFAFRNWVNLLPLVKHGLQIAWSFAFVLFKPALYVTLFFKIVPENSKKVLS